ncbi:MAG: DegT/DnrJ/EryC1/StrS family aminotransferase [Candidatus Latescibacteria bacterium]|nr:DegT/DnrJ/EryC1/StrS family aminotransferase [Candidatus Latescibacterota bacterium]
MNSSQWPREFPGAHWYNEEEENAVLNVIRRGTPFRHYGLNTPEYVASFEKAACEFYDVKYALGVNSGTGALITAITALGMGPGCEVILPSFMWVATVTAIVNANAIPVICEIDDSFTMDPVDLEKKITPRTKLILVVHMAGVPCQMDAIMNIANRHGIKVLEDVAQCNGGLFQGKKLGTFGDVGMFSLQLNKNMTTGEGGLVVTDNDLMYERLQTAHDTGYIWKDGSPVLPSPESLGWGSGRRMSELIGAVASVQIKKMPSIIEHMRGSYNRIKDFLRSNISDLEFRTLNDPAGHTGPFMIIRLKNEDQAKKAARYMKENGLPSIARLADYGLHIYYNIAQLVNKTPLSPSGNPWNLEKNKNSFYNYGKGACPYSDELFSKSIVIPIPSKLTVEQEKDAADVITKAVLKSRD